MPTKVLIALVVFACSACGRVASDASCTEAQVSERSNLEASLSERIPRYIESAAAAEEVTSATPSTRPYKVVRPDCLPASYSCTAAWFEENILNQRHGAEFSLTNAEQKVLSEERVARDEVADDLERWAIMVQEFPVRFSPRERTTAVIVDRRLDGNGISAALSAYQDR